MLVKYKNVSGKRGTFNELRTSKRTKGKYLKESLLKVKYVEEFPPLKRRNSQEVIGSCKQIADDQFEEVKLSEGDMCFEEWRWQEYQQNTRGKSYLEYLFGLGIWCPEPAHHGGVVASSLGGSKEEYAFNNIQNANGHIGGAWTPPRPAPASFVDALRISRAKAEPAAHSSADTTKQHLASIATPPLPFAPVSRVLPSSIQPISTNTTPNTNRGGPVKSRTIPSLISPSETISTTAPTPVATRVPPQSHHSFLNLWFLQLSDQFGSSKILSSLDPLFQEGNFYAESYGYPTVSCKMFGTMVVRNVSPVLSKRRDLTALFSPYVRAKAELKSLF